MKRARRTFISGRRDSKERAAFGSAVAAPAGEVFRSQWFGGGAPELTGGAAAAREGLFVKALRCPVKIVASARITADPVRAMPVR